MNITELSYILTKWYFITYGYYHRLFFRTTYVKLIVWLQNVGRYNCLTKMKYTKYLPSLLDWKTQHIVNLRLCMLLPRALSDQISHMMLSLMKVNCDGDVCFLVWIHLKRENLFWKGSCKIKQMNLYWVKFLILYFNTGCFEWFSLSCANVTRIFFSKHINDGRL